MDAAPHHGPRINPASMTPKVWPVTGTGLKGRGTETRDKAAVSAANSEERMADLNLAEVPWFLKMPSPWPLGLRTNPAGPRRKLPADMLTCTRSQVNTALAVGLPPVAVRCPFLPSWPVARRCDRPQEIPSGDPKLPESPGTSPRTEGTP